MRAAPGRSSPAKWLPRLLTPFALVAMIGAADRAAHAQDPCVSHWGFSMDKTASQAHGAAVGDWNADGVRDFAVALSGGAVQVYLGTGHSPLDSGSFSAPVTIPVGGTPFAVIASRINQDAVPDLVTANYASGTISVLIGNGDGSFANPISFPAGTHPFDLVSADFNADGRADLAVTDNDCSSGGFAILMALPPGVPGQVQFAAPVRYNVGCNAGLIATSDFNEDGHPDLAIAIYSDNRIRIMTGSGGSAFTSTFTVADVGGAYDIKAADLDQDGIVDLVSGSGAGISILWGQGAEGIGNGTFAYPQFILGGGRSFSVGIGDQDGDGDLDVVGNIDGNVRLFVQILPRVFTTASDLLPFASALTPRLTDLDGDGRDDLLVCLYGGGLVKVVGSRCQPWNNVPPDPDPSGPGWETQGRVVAASTVSQVDAVTIPDDLGGVFIVWMDGQQVRAQRMSAAGERLWGAGGIVLCDNGVGQAAVSAIRDGAGGLYVSWSSYGWRLQRISSSGAVAAGWPPCGLIVSPNPAASQYPAGLAPDGAGGVFVSNVQNGSGVVFRYSASGLPAAGWVSTGREFDPGSSSKRPLTARVVYNGLGSWTVGVISRVTGGSEFVPQYYGMEDIYSISTAGVPTLKSWLQLQDGTLGPLTAVDQGKSMLTYWNYGGSVRGLALDPNGGALWTVVLGPGQVSQTIPRVSPDGAGGAYFVWDAIGAQAADLFATRTTSLGAIAEGWSNGASPLLSLPGDQREVQLVQDGDGFDITWRDARSGDSDIYFTRLDGLGHARSGWAADGMSIVSVPGEQRRPVVTLTSPLTAIVVWEDLRNGTSQLYAQRVALDQPVAALASLQVVSATSTRTTLRWQVSGASAPVQVQRSAHSGEWIVVGEAHAAGEGLLEWVDEGVRPADRFGYRLVDTSIGAPISGSETWVTTPNELSLALKGFDPNPAANGASVRFTLPVASPADLRVFDVTGRQVVSRDVGSLGAGRHQVGLGTLPPGFYVIRLEQSGESRVQRGIVLR